jgi:hypothetical protein
VTNKPTLVNFLRALKVFVQRPLGFVFYRKTLTDLIGQAKTAMVVGENQQSAGAQARHHLLN